MGAIFFLLAGALGLNALVGRGRSKNGSAALVVDVQGDFTHARKGSLAVEGTDQAYIEKIQEAAVLCREQGIPVFATQDCHPADHISFAGNHPGFAPFDTKCLPGGKSQVLWPDHCVENTPGAEILFDTDLIHQVVSKGGHPDFDSYSGFRDDGGAETGLETALKKAGVKTLVIFGIATDYCVKFTVLHALEFGFEVVVVRDLCRGVASGTSRDAWREMEGKGAHLASDLSQALEWIS